MDFSKNLNNRQNITIAQQNNEKMNHLNHELENNSAVALESFRVESKKIGAKAIRPGYTIFENIENIRPSKDFRI